MRRISEDELIWRKKFGNKLKRLINLKGMTQGEFAAKAGVSDVVLSRYITGTCDPNTYRVGQFARILECDIKTLYDVDN